MGCPPGSRLSSLALLLFSVGDIRCTDSSSAVHVPGDMMVAVSPEVKYSQAWFLTEKEIGDPGDFVRLLRKILKRDRRA